MKRSAVVLALAFATPLVVTACSKKSDAPAPTASATAPAVAACPGGSVQDGNNCKAKGQSRIATLTWNQAIGDSAQVFTLKSGAAATLKNASVTLWFYDKTGQRLDEAGAKKYVVPGDAFGVPLKAGASRPLSFTLAKTGLPDGTTEIEAEVVQATLVNPDGSDGWTWKNDDLNVDDRPMAGAPPPIAPPAYAATNGAAPLRPGRRPAPPPPPPAHH